MSRNTVKLLDVCGFKGGSQPAKAAFSAAEKTGYVRLLQIQDYSTDAYRVYIPKDHRLSFCDEKDVLLGRYGASVGKVCRGKSGAHNVALLKAVPDRKALTPEYLYYLFRSQRFQGHVLQQSRRAAQAGLSEDSLSDFSINLPSIPVQIATAESLDSKFDLIDRARSHIKLQLANLVSLAHSLISRSTSVGTCNLKVVGEVLDETKGGIGSSWSSLPVLGATRAGLAPARERPGKLAERYKPVDAGTVFYNPMRILIGSIAFVDDDDEPGITSPDYVVLKGKPGVVDSRWFYYWLRSPLGERCIQSLARGAVRERMLFNRLAEGEIELPDYDTQVKASKALAQIKPLRQAIQQQLKELELLPQKLLAQVFDS